MQYPCGKYTDEEQTKSDCGTFSCSLFLVCLHVIFWYTLHAVYLNIYVVSAGQRIRYFVNLLFVHLKATNRYWCSYQCMRKLCETRSLKLYLWNHAPKIAFTKLFTWRYGAATITFWEENSLFLTFSVFSYPVFGVLCSHWFIQFKKLPFIPDCIRLCLRYPIEKSYLATNWFLPAYSVWTVRDLCRVSCDICDT